MFMHYNEYSYSTNPHYEDHNVYRADERIFVGRRPFGGFGRPLGFGRPFFGGPFVGGLVGGLVGSALLAPRPPYPYYPPYYGYGYGPSPYPYYGGYGYGGYGGY